MKSLIHFKKYIFTAVILAFTLTISPYLYAQEPMQTKTEVKSDYEIQKNFKEKYEALSESIDSAEKSEQMQKIIKQIKMLQTDYEKHSELLNKALHPKTFSGQMTNLKKQAVMSRERLVTIEKQQEKLKKLNDQLASYDSRITNLNQRNQELQKEIQKSVQSEKRLSSLVRKYRKNLEKRDDLILSYIDSMMVSYKKLNIQSLEDLENAEKKARFNGAGNAVKMIQTVAQENIAFLNSNAELATEEYLRMNAVQQKFEDMWNQMGPKLVDIYAEDNPKELRKKVEGTIQEWDNKITQSTWSSLNNHFEKKNIDIAKFSDRQSFYRSLNSFLDKAIKKSKENSSEEQYDDYQKFYKLWTQTVQIEWSDYFHQGDILTSKQMATVDQKVDLWAANAKPKSNFLVYLLGASVLAVVVLGVMLAKEKGSGKEEKKTPNLKA